MYIKKLYLLIFIINISFSHFVSAQTVNHKNKSELTVEADESLEWFEKEKILYCKRKCYIKKRWGNSKS